MECPLAAVHPEAADMVNNLLNNPQEATEAGEVVMEDIK